MKTSIITFFVTSLHQSILHVFSISANSLLRPFWLHLFAIFVLIAEFASSYLSSSPWKGHSNVHCCWNLISSRHSSTSQTIISPNGLPSTGFFHSQPGFLKSYWKFCWFSQIMRCFIVFYLLLSKDCHRMTLHCWLHDTSPRRFLCQRLESYDIIPAHRWDNCFKVSSYIMHISNVCGDISEVAVCGKQEKTCGTDLSTKRISTSIANTCNFQHCQTTTCRNALWMWCLGVISSVFTTFLLYLARF